MGLIEPPPAVCSLELSGGGGDVVRCGVDVVKDSPGVIPPGEFGCASYGFMDQECLED